MRDHVTISVDAAPQRVYLLVSDVPRMGEWSSECYRCRWNSQSDGPWVGGRFRAWNRRGLLRWSNRPEVIIAEPGSEFAFRRVAPGAGEVIWRYRMQATAMGTRLTESYEVVRPSGALVRLAMFVLAGARDRRTQLRQSMTETLARLKAAAEA